MRKLYELLGRAEPVKGLFGIEIEAEGKGMKAIDTAFWQSEDDGSLRGRFPDTRIEWVLKKPIVLEKVMPALKELTELQKTAKINFSFRTSVHVHVNMHELTHPQVLNVIYTYLLLEEPLLSFCGEERKANRFCLRLKDAEGLMEDLQKVFIGGEGALFGIAPNAIRYASINLEALKKYGSMEFRGMRGTMDVNIIHTWVEILNKIREYSMKMDDVEAIHQEFRDLGANEFVKNIMGGKLTKVLGDDFEKELNLSYSLSLDLPYTYKRYKELPKEEYKVKAKRYGAEWGAVPGALQAAVRVQPIVPMKPLDPELMMGHLPELVEGMDFEQWEAARKEIVAAEIQRQAAIIAPEAPPKPKRKPRVVLDPEMARLIEDI